jgi:outer membrane lipoprotein LolB
LTACVAPSRIGGHAPDLPAFPDAFALIARFSLQFTPPDAPYDAAPRSLSGKLEWQHQPERDDLLFLGPLEQGVARLQRDASGSVALTEANGRQHTANSADDLLEKALGVPLPFDDLVAWSMARPGNGALVERDELGRPYRVRESGWFLVYRYDGDSRLPARLDASLSNRLKLRLVAESWEILP